MLTSSKFALSRFLVPAAGLGAFAVATLLYLGDRPAYVQVMTALMKLPAPRPFVDWEWIPSAVRCWSDGVNVYVNNTCYQVWPNQTFNYSPLWLRASFLRSGESWTNAFMLSVCVLFFLWLATLPPPRRARDQVIALLAALSCATVLAMERGNADLVIFLFVMAALNLRRLALPFRLAGYALLALAGLLKFYPFMALVIVLRERFAIVASVATASAAALLALAISYREELGWMAQNLPHPSYYTLQFSAANLPVGLGVTVAKLLEKGAHQGPDAARTIGGMVSLALLPLFVIAAAVAALALGRRTRLPSALAELPPYASDALVVGAALICGCFFAIPSVIYRGIFLLLTLPGLALLAQRLGDAPGRKVLGAACAAAPFVLWVPFLAWCLSQAGLGADLPYQGSPYGSFPGLTLGYLLWLAGELGWWLIVTVLLSVLGAFAVRTELWAALSRLGRPADPGRVEARAQASLHRQRPG